MMECEPAPFRITVDVFEENGRILRVKENSFFYYLLIDFEEFEENGIPSEYLDEIEKRFKIEVEAHIEDHYDADEKLSEAPNFQYFSPWMQGIILEIEKK